MFVGNSLDPSLNGPGAGCIRTLSPVRMQRAALRTHGSLLEAPAEAQAGRAQSRCSANARSFSLQLPIPGIEDDSRSLKKMSPEGAKWEQGALISVLWQDSHLSYNCLLFFFLKSPLKRAIILWLSLFFILSKIIQCPPFPLGKSKVDMATFWTGAVKDPFLLFKKFHWFWKVLLIKHRETRGKRTKRKKKKEKE